MRFALRWIGTGFLAGLGVLAGWYFGQWCHRLGVELVTCGWL